MGSKSSKVKRPAPVKTKALTVPRIPQDLVDEILDHLATDSDQCGTLRPNVIASLRACALVSKAWVQPCQRHLFHTISFTPYNTCRWLETFPVQEGSPANHVRDLRLNIGDFFRLPEMFFKRIPWFTDVDSITLSGRSGVPLGYKKDPFPLEPSSWRLPRSATSLTVNTGAITLLEVRDIMAQLPNLDNLAFLGNFAKMDRGKLPGIGMTLKGRFGGLLMLNGESVGEDVINMLLEIPSGLHFTELDFYCTRNRLPSSAVRLAEACAKSLVKLSHGVSLLGKSLPFRLVHARNTDADTISRYNPPRNL